MGEGRGRIVRSCLPLSFIDLSSLYFLFPLFILLSLSLMCESAIPISVRYRNFWPGFNPCPTPDTHVSSVAFFLRRLGFAPFCVPSESYAVVTVYSVFGAINADMIRNMRGLRVLHIGEPVRLPAGINREFDVVLGNFADEDGREFVWPEMLHNLLTSYQLKLVKAPYLFEGMRNVFDNEAFQVLKDPKNIQPNHPRSFSIAFLNSHCAKGPPSNACLRFLDREMVVQEALKNGVTIESGGECSRNVAPPILQVPEHLRRRGGDLLEKKYFFGSHIGAFVPENSACDGGCYFTEKLFEAMVAGTVPFYFGCHDVLKIFHPDRVVLVENVTDAITKMKGFLMSFESIQRAHSAPILAPGYEKYLSSLQDEVLHGFSQAIALRGILNMTR